MQRLKSAPIEPDETWYKRLISIALIYRAVAKMAREERFPAYQANIVAYTVAALGQVTGGRLDFTLIWDQQNLTADLRTMVRQWTRDIDRLLRETAGARMPTEWAKKDECWEEIRRRLPTLPESLPAELAQQGAVFGNGGEPVSMASTSLSHEDYEAIRKVMEFDGAKWLEIAERGQRSKAIHWKLASICRTLAQYAAGSWERRPSAKQARAGLAALEKVENVAGSGPV